MTDFIVQYQSKEQGKQQKELLRFCPADPAELPTMPPCKRMASAAHNIDSMNPGKEKRSALHKVVGDFREAHGEKRDAEGMPQANYWRQVLQYHDLIALVPDRPIIEKLSSPAVYARIRQAGRARISMGPLGDKELSILCGEIRAALIWREIGSYNGN